MWNIFRWTTTEPTDQKDYTVKNINEFISKPVVLYKNVGLYFTCAKKIKWHKQ